MIYSSVSSSLFKSFLIDVHTGKMNVNEVKQLFDALGELILIFEDVMEGIRCERYKL